MTALYNEKVKEEKEKEKSGKTSKKPKIAAGKQHQNAQMMNDLMGEDDYGDEEGYGDEDDEGLGGKAKKGKGKAPEEEYDFM